MNSSVTTSTLYALERHSFSDQAAQRVMQAGLVDSVANSKSIQSVLQSTSENEGNQGLLPFENSNAGVVWPHLDALRDGRFSITGEIQHPVVMCAGVHPDNHNVTTEVVCSHPKAIEQSTKFVNGRPTQEKFGSTAEAAQFVSEHPELLGIALGTREALESHKLLVTNEDIANLQGKENITRFFMVRQNGKVDGPDVEKMHHALLLDLPDYPGSLADALNALRSGASLTSLHSRNVGHMQYQFFMQLKKFCKHRDPNEQLGRVTDALHALVGKENARWLGSWDTLITHESYWRRHETPTT